MYGLYYCYILVPVLLCVNSLDEIITGEQGKSCHMSNFCERPLTLMYRQRKTNRRPFDLSNNPGINNVPNVWNVVHSNNKTYKGKRNKDVTLIIKGRSNKNFDVRRICVNVKTVKLIDATFNLADGRVERESVSVTQGDEKQQICMKNAARNHFLVTSVELLFIRQRKIVILSDLIFIACGDRTGLGKTTVPNANTTKRTLENPGRPDCFDQFHINYSNHDLKHFYFTDGMSGDKELNALDGSNDRYIGEVDKNVQFTFTYRRSKEHKSFVWWRVCFLIQNVKTVTYRMDAEINSLVENITVCNPASYLWKCYNPWNKFYELETGKIILYPARNSKIKVSTMSITICLDNEFKGKIVRIGKASKKCVDKAKVTEICENLVKIQRDDATNFTSPFDLSDSNKQHNNSAGWQTVSGPRDPYVAEPGNNISLTYKLNTPCPLHRDGLFQARKIQFWGKNIGQVAVKFCDVKHPNKEKEIFCELKNGFLNLIDPGVGKIVAPRIPPKTNQLFIINNWNPVTHVNILALPRMTTEPMVMYWFNVFACCDARHVKRDEKDDPQIGQDQDRPKVTGNKCTFFHRLVHQTHRQYESKVFNFDDRDKERDENMALEGSNQIYTGAPGKNIYFYISFHDKKNFEWWQICGKYYNIQKITYVMETSKVTFIESTIICGIDAPQRRCYAPRDQGMIVRRGAVKFEVVPGRVGRIFNFEAQACRDHFNYDFFFHIDPCDYKSLVINTPRNQTISIYGVKDQDGMLLQTELYHFTDHTGNDGDNTWFTLEPKHHLVSAIWTDRTYIKLKWDIQRRRVVFDVHITAGNKAHTKITMLDLSELKKLEDSSKFNESSTDNEPSKNCKRIPFQVEQCGSKVSDLVVNAEVEAKSTFQMPARYLTGTDEYEFVLPKKLFASNTQFVIGRQCSAATRTKTRECEKHAIFNRIQHHFLCDGIKNVIKQYDKPGVLDVSRIFQACLLTYKTLDWTCSVMADRSRFDTGFFFGTVCPKIKVHKVELYKNFIDRNVVDITTTGKDLDNRVIETSPSKVSIRLNQPLQPLIGDSTEGDFKVNGITTDPKRIPHLFPNPYQVCVNYSCPTGDNGDRKEEIILFPKSGNTTPGNLQRCFNLIQMAPCCITMPPRLTKAVKHSVAVTYISAFLDESVTREELIPTVDP